MGRKNIFAKVLEDEPAPIARPVISGERGPGGAVTRSFKDLAERADAAETRLKAGQAIVELDAALVDPSFVTDRMTQDDEAYQQLRTAIEKDGQTTPILVRSHPAANGRYQVAFGHRRLRVAKDLGRPVRAVVKELNDEQLILAQGQENSARSDLSYIERARFARSLEHLGYGRDVIMSALTVDKAALSRMLGILERIPADVIEAIGAAHGIGRRRWLELAEQFGSENKPSGIEHLLADETFKSAASDRRFDLVHAAKREGQGTTRGPRSYAQHWVADNGARVMTMTHNVRSEVITIDRRHAPGFGEFLLGRMDQLFREYQSKHQS